MQRSKIKGFVTLLVMMIHFFTVGQTSQVIDSLKNSIKVTDDPLKKIELMIDVAQFLIPTDLEDALRYANMAKEGLKVDYDIRFQLENLATLGIIYKEFGAYKIALNKQKTGLKLMDTLINQYPDSAKYILAKGQFHENLGIVYRLQGDFEKALEAYILANKIFIEQFEKSENDSSYLSYIGNSYNNIGVVHSSLGRRDKAIYYFNKSIDIRKNIQDPVGAMYAIHNLGCEYKLNNEYDEALSRFEEALVVAKDANIKSVELRTYIEIADIALIKKDYSKSIKYFNMALKMAEERKDQDGILQANKGIGKLFMEKGEMKKAEQFFLKSLALAQENGTKVFIATNYNDLSALYEQSGNNKEALKYHKLYKEVSDDLFDQNSDRAVSAMEAAFTSDLKEKELAYQAVKIESLEKDKAINLWMNWSLLIGLILLTLIMTVIYLHQKTTLKKNKELFSAKNKMISYELENIRLKEKELERELVFKNKELTTHTLNLVQKNGIMEELKQNIKEIAKSLEGEPAKKINQVKRLIDYSFNLDKDWSNFKLHFEQVHHNFFNELMEHYPELTASECRLCALIKLNLSTKEIASIMGINPESVKVARYRLRKKLGLEGQQKLPEFLINFNQIAAA